MMPAAVAGSPPGMVTASTRSDAAAACVRTNAREDARAGHQIPGSTLLAAAEIRIYTTCTDDDNSSDPTAGDEVPGCS